MLNGILTHLENISDLSGFNITPYLRQQGTQLPAVVVQLSNLRPLAEVQQHTADIDRAEIRIIVLHSSTGAAFAAAKSIRENLQSTKDLSIEGINYYEFIFNRMDAGSVEELELFTVSLDFEITLEQY